MRQLKVYESVGMVYFDFYDTTTLITTPIGSDTIESVAVSIINNPPQIDKLTFWHKYGDVAIVSYQFDQVINFTGTPYSTVSAQLALDNITLALGLTIGGGGGDASAVNQELEIAELEAMNANIGSKSDAAAVDDTGEFSLISLFKRLLSFGVKIRDAATNAALNFGQQLMANSLPVTIASNQTPVPVTFGTENPKYAVAVNYTIANTPTDFFGIVGSNTKKVKILSIMIYAQESQLLGGGAIRTITAVKRSTNSTGGTTTPVVRVPLDSGSAAATATVVAYTANPTVGTTVGTVGTYQLTHPINNTISAQYGLELIKEPVILNNATQGLYLNGLGVTKPNNSYSITIIWEEY